MRYSDIINIMKLKQCREMLKVCEQFGDTIGAKKCKDAIAELESKIDTEAILKELDYLDDKRRTT